MEAISVEHSDEYYKDVDDNIKSLIRRYTLKVVPRNYVSDHIIISWV